VDLGLGIDSYISDKLKGNEVNDIDDWPPLPWNWKFMSLCSHIL
jgi:hypothetical protein